MSNILIIPGRGGSPEGHWQTDLEETLPRTRRVEQDDWNKPDLDAWAGKIAIASKRLRRPSLAIAHSFGCLALAHAVLKYGARFSASFMVAPADPVRFGFADALVFQDLEHRSELLVSTTDPWLSVDKASRMATAWGSRLHVLGDVGHINVASGFGPWPEMRCWARLGVVARNHESALHWQAARLTFSELV